MNDAKNAAKRCVQDYSFYTAPSVPAVARPFHNSSPWITPMEVGHSIDERWEVEMLCIAQSSKKTTVLTSIASSATTATWLTDSTDSVRTII